VEAAVRAAREHRCGRVDGLQPEGAPTIQLLRLARDADLVVVGAAGRDPDRAMRFGSLGHTVSARSNCPTVVVRHTTA
jgi:nucleotide-binding universal stress UspA family protein